MTGTKASKDASREADETRMRYGFWLILISLFLISGLFVLVAYEVPFDDPTDIATGLPAVTTLFGTLVGFYFGHQAGSSGKERAEASRRQSEAVARAALAHIDPTKSEQVRDYVQYFLDDNSAPISRIQEHE
jgi:hypothetical protein